MSKEKVKLLPLLQNAKLIFSQNHEQCYMCFTVENKRRALIPMEHFMTGEKTSQTGVGTFKRQKNQSFSLNVHPLY